MSLTQRKVDKLAKPGKYRDGLIPGLYLTIGERGARSWILRYEFRGREHVMGLGSARTFDLRQARERARAARQQLADGIDPLADKHARAAAAALETARRMTFAAAAAAYVEQHEPKWSIDHRDRVLSSLAHYAFPAIGDLSVADIGVQEILRVLEPIWSTKTATADRVRNRIERVLDWAKARALRSGDNPASWKVIGHILPPARAVAPVRHHPAMAYAEVPSFMAELRAMHGAGARALEFTILAAVRASEGFDAVWSEIDLVDAVWTVPAARMKARREHRVPLSPPALELLRSLPRADDNPHVFAGRNLGSRISGMTVSRVLRALRPHGAFTIHGFRSSFRDWAAERTNYPREIAEMALAHTVGTAVERAYRRTDLFDRRRRLMTDWAKFCTAPPAAGKVVVPIRA